jgi:hypothetical protein
MTKADVLVRKWGRAIMVVVLSGLAWGLTAPAIAQSWDYKAFNRNGDYTGSGYITLRESASKGVFRMYAGNNVDKCVDGEINAAIAKTAETTTITTEPRVVGCPEMRFVIKNDGSGGHKEMKRGDEWVPDGFERGLKLRK